MTVAEKLPAAVLLIGVLALIAGLLSRTSHKYMSFTTGLFERDLAIEQAIASGQKNYSYTSHFIPGIGYIANPQQYKEKALHQTK